MKHNISQKNNKISQKKKKTTNFHQKISKRQQISKNTTFHKK